MSTVTRTLLIVSRCYLQYRDMETEESKGKGSVMIRVRIYVGLCSVQWCAQRVRVFDTECLHCRHIATALILAHIQ